jgi:hypothetical protein
VLWQKKRGQELTQLVEQVWFPGAHSNVGGGWSDTSISDLALTWMIRRVQANSGLSFDEDYIARHIRPDPFGGIYDSRTPLYTMSRICPFQRRLGQNAVETSGLQRLLEQLGCYRLRTNRPHEGCEFVNEMIHWSALQRFGQTASEDGRLRRYRPANLEAAIGRLPVADERLARPGQGAELPALVPPRVPLPEPRGSGVRAAVPAG